MLQRRADPLRYRAAAAMRSLPDGPPDFGNDDAVGVVPGSAP
jgi:hypothetical protein